MDERGQKGEPEGAYTWTTWYSRLEEREGEQERETGRR